MTIKTRTKAASPVRMTTAVAPIESTVEPLKLFVLPKERAADARFLVLPHPADGTEQTFYYCPRHGLFEFKKVLSQSLDPRSVLFSSTIQASPDHRPVSSQNASEKATSSPISDGFVKKDAEFYIATRFDLSFLLLGVLTQATSTTCQTLFQSLDDLMEEQADRHNQMKYILEKGEREVLEAMSRICDTVEAGDETMFRISDDKILGLLLQRAERVVAQGLPSSLEERFVTRVLERPILNVARDDVTVPSNILPEGSEGLGSNQESFETQASSASTALAVFSEASTTTSISTVVCEDCPTEIKRLQRLRTAFRFISASCLPPSLLNRLENKLDQPGSSIKFTLLNAYLEKLSLLRAEAAATRSISDFSRKRGVDDEEIESRAEKKRKQEEDDKKKKAGVSTGVRDLKKVNISGMKKMNDFFTKKPAAAKAKT